MKKKLIIQNILVITCVVFVLGLVSILVSNNILSSQDKSYLSKITDLKITDVTYGDNNSYQRAIANLENVDIRVSIIAKDGTMLADSDYDITTMENHIDRKEIQSLLKGEKFGYDVRKSTTGSKNSTYYARKVMDSNGIDFIIYRVSSTTGAIFEYMKIILPTIITAMVVLLAFSIMLSIRINKKVMQSLEMIEKGMQSLNNGDYIRLMPNFKDDVLNGFVVSINDLQGKINHNMESLNDEKSKLNQIINRLANGVIVVDNKLNVVMINDFAKRLYRVRTDTENKDVLSLDIGEQILGYLNDTIKKSTKYNFELIKNGRYFNVIIRKVNDNVIILYNEITAIKEYTNYKDEFFANASHELKTPITSIVGFVELYDGAKSEEEREKYINRIGIHSKRLMKLIVDMLEVTNLDNVKRIEDAVNIDIANVAERVIKRYDYLTLENHINCEVDGNASIIGTESTMDMLLDNFISNAVRYNKPNGSVNIRITKTDDGVQIKIRDTGIGILPEDRERIFERFYCVDKSRSKQSGGTGLGLPIATRIVTLYSGRIDIKSEIGVGTEFTITIKDINN